MVHVRKYVDPQKQMNSLMLRGGHWSDFAVFCVKTFSLREDGEWSRLLHGMKDIACSVVSTMSVFPVLWASQPQK